MPIQNYKMVYVAVEAGNNETVYPRFQNYVTD